MDKKTSSIEKVFLITSQKLVLAPEEYKKKLTSLYSICEASTVFLKTSSSLSRAMLLSPDKPLHTVASTAQWLPVFLLCDVDSTRA